jgi:hypothetical protein
MKEIVMKSVMHTLQVLACLGLVGLAENVGLAAQAPQAPKEQSQTPAIVAPTPEPPPLIPLSVQVVVSRYQGEKKVSSLPYTLAVNANVLRRGGSVSSLRMGAQIPVPNAGFPRPDGKGPAVTGPMEYRAFGTNIDAWANSIDSNHFQVNISIEDSSVYAADQVNSSAQRASDLPVFRSYRTQNELVLRDGQSAQFTAASDRVSGEVIKVDVTLSLLK